MKKLLGSFVLGMLVLSSCKKAAIADAEPLDQDATTTVSQRNCTSMDHLQDQLAEDPSLQSKMDAIDDLTRKVERGLVPMRLLADGTVEIPVVFNVLYRTAAENVSLAQLQSQIDVLNEDYSGANADYNASNPYNSVKAGDIKVRFVLDQVIRKSTTKTSWTTNDAMKKSNRGGLNPTSPTTKLNIWVCNMGGGILGYAQFPGGSSSTDGVVLDNNATGRTGTAAAPFNLGRTATHEVGHWLNLRHIWGDATCGNDQVGDTPLHNTANYGCPAAGHRSTCTGTPLEMTMNYMDYTDDACMYMFSAGQKTRMLATFNVGGGRTTFAQ